MELQKTFEQNDQAELQQELQEDLAVLQEELDEEKRRNESLCRKMRRMEREMKSLRDSAVSNSSGGFFRSIRCFLGDEKKREKPKQDFAAQQTLSEYKQHTQNKRHITKPDPTNTIQSRGSEEGDELTSPVGSLP